MASVDPTAAPLFKAIAQEIREIRMLIEAIADVLVADETLVMTYLAQFQSFDLAIQRSDEAAALLDRLAEGSGARAAVDAVRLTSVQDRLALALASGGDRHGENV